MAFPLRSPVPKGREVLKPQVLVGEQFSSEDFEFQLSLYHLQAVGS